MMKLRHRMKTGVVGVAAVLLLSTANVAMSAPITLDVNNISGGGFSASWLHSAASCTNSGSKKGFCMNGDAERFTPMEIIGDWNKNNNRLTILSTTGGEIDADITAAPGGVDLLKDDIFSFTGGVIQQNAGGTTGGTAGGYIEYEINRTGTGLIDSGIFFIFPDLDFAGDANAFNSTTPQVDFTTWSNNWVNGFNRDWSFLEDLNSDFAVTFNGTDTTAVTLNGLGVAHTSDGSVPGPHFTSLGLDLNASGTPVVPEPASMILFGSGLVGLAAWRRMKMSKNS